MQLEAEGPARRGTQTALTLFAIVITVGAYVLVTLGKTGKTPPGVGGFVAVIVAGYLVAQFIVIRFAQGAKHDAH